MVIYNNNKIDLNIGQIVKNYKEMCRLLNEEIKAGDSKKAQISQWERYFSFIRDGNKYIITEIYNEPLPLSDIKRREGVYIQYIECLLMNILANSVSGTLKRELTISKKNLYVALGMVNSEYNQYYDESEREILVKIINRISECCTYYDEMSNSKDISNVQIDENDIKYFYKNVGMELSKILNRALSSMMSRKLIKYYSSHIIEFNDENSSKSNKEYDYNEYFYNNYNEDSVSIVSDLGHLANEDEEREILGIEREVLTQMGYDSLRDVIWRGKIKKYHQKLDYAISQHNPKWKYVYPVLHIIYNDNIKEHLPLQAEKVRQLSVSQQRSELNSAIQVRLEQAIQSDYNNKEKKFEEYLDNDGWGYNPMEKMPFRYRKEHINGQKKLMSYLTQKANENDLTSA